MDQGVKLVIRPGSLEEDIAVSANMVREQDRVCFYFGPDGTTFADNKPAELWISWQTIDDASELILYGEDGEEIEPNIKKEGLVWHIPHFSLYYYRRR